MRHLDLFSGIGGFALAARWMGWQTVGFCEIEPYPQAVLRKNFPGIPIFPDVSTLNAAELVGLGRIDLVTGGVPCQPHSVAGLRRGRDDPRHLWPDTARIIKKARPSWCVIENVPGLRSTAADEYLSDLESLGYACWPVVVGAVHAGAPHRRQRVWIVAHSESERWRGRVESQQNVEHDRFQSALLGADAADADAARLEVGRGIGRDAEPQRTAAERGRYLPDWRGWSDAPQPAICRLDDGLPAGLAGGCRVQKLKALGNAIVPQVALEIFRAIEASRHG